MLRQGVEVVGICDGLEGIFEGRTREISFETIRGLHTEAGTFLGTSNKTRLNGREEEFRTCFAKLKLDGIVAAGGDGTFAALKSLQADIPLIGVPKTIDNDLSGTDITFGYDTACSVVAESADALRATATAHRRIMVIEAMGRTAGWIALGGGLASMADVILIPERPFDKKKLIEFVNGRKKTDRGLVMVVSESAHAQGESSEIAFRVPGSFQEERYGGIAERLARWLEVETGWESRHVVLGHLQRSRAPTTTDRFLTLMMGAHAARLALEKNWNRAVVYREGRVLDVPLIEIQGAARTVPSDHRWVKLAEQLGIFI